MKLEIKRGIISWYVRLVGGNGKILMHSETYYKSANAVRAAQRLSKQMNIPWTYEQP